jgi:hypothetical protein
MLGVEPRSASPLARAGRLEGAIEDRPGPIRGGGHQNPQGQRQAHPRPHMIGTPMRLYEVVRIILFPDEAVKMKGASHRVVFRNGGENERRQPSELRLIEARKAAIAASVSRISTSARSRDCRVSLTSLRAASRASFALCRKIGKI